MYHMILTVTTVTCHVTCTSLPLLTLSRQFPEVFLVSRLTPTLATWRRHTDWIIIIK